MRKRKSAAVCLSAETKEPINRVLVEAIRVTDPFDIATSVTGVSARTFPDGQFSLAQLVPGQYFFRFTPANERADVNRRWT